MSQHYALSSYALTCALLKTVISPKRAELLPHARPGLYMYVYMRVCIYIYRERERCVYVCISLSLSLYIYIYRERDIYELIFYVCAPENPAEQQQQSWEDAGSLARSGLYNILYCNIT